MNSKDIIYEAMKRRGFTQKMLQKNLKFKNVSNVSELLRSKSMRVDNFVKLLSAMNYDVIVVSQKSGEDSWKVGDEK